MTVGMFSFPDGFAAGTRPGSNAWGMEGPNEVSNSRNISYTSRQIIFPPTSPFPFFTDCSSAEPQRNQILLEGKHGHQRCSSESVLIEEEQPSWLEELLNEPEVQHVHKGHRRSASDSSAYLDAAVETFNMREEYKSPNFALHSPWSSQNFVHRRDPNAISFSEQYNTANEAPLNYCNAFVRDGIMLQDSGSAAIDNREQVEAGSQKPESSSGPSGRSDYSQAKTCASKAEAKRAKQQSARQSRVRKLQYIAELERNVQVLQAEESLGAAKFGFLDQQNLILVMENRDLRQRLESLSQEQLIKHLEQEMLERELVRLQIMYQLQRQQQQQQRQPQKHHPKHHRQSKSRDSFANLSTKNKEASSSTGTLRDLQSHFASLSLRHKEASSSCGSLNGSLCM